MNNLEKEFASMYDRVATSFRYVAAERGEKLTQQTLTNIVLKFISMADSLDDTIVEEHLAYELAKYRKEGLRPSYGESREKSSGTWSSLVGIIQEANEDTHGVRLRKELTSTFANMTDLDGNVRAYALVKFMEKREKLRSNMVNWSRDGRLKMGRTLQTEARKQFEFNQAESYALWLAGAWIESGERRTKDAYYVHSFLESFARQAEATDQEELSGVRHTRGSGRAPLKKDQEQAAELTKPLVSMIIACAKCGQKLRVPRGVFMDVTCPRCKGKARVRT